jgi:hypothetical protein
MQRGNRGKIISIAKGGIGNQLFIYSAGRSLAENLGYIHLIESEIGFKGDSYKRHFLLNKFKIQSNVLASHERPFKNLRNPKHKIIRSYNKLLPIQFRSYIAESHGINPHKLRSLKTKRKNIILNGNWCNEEFFIKHKDILKQELPPPEVKDPENIKVLEQIKKSSNSAFIHVRRVRYKSKLNMEYYLNAIQNLKSRVGECNFFLFADDFDWAMQKFKKHIDFTPVQHNQSDELADLWLMSHCQNAIIANSGFSWWAAWLINDDKKVVISPNNQNWHMKPASGWHTIAFQP